ncbi:DUF5753 domain-containing protein [Streptomyces sp. NPDC002537]
MGHPARRTALRRKLGAELRTLREAAAVSVEEAATAIHGDRTKISRQETGRHRVTRLELETLFTLYKCEDEQLRQWLIALSAQGGGRAWWRQHGESFRDGFKEMLTLESDAARIAAFQPRVVPGLLQTQEYAAAVITDSAMELPPEGIDFYVDIRMSRQSIFLRGNPPKYTAIMAEGVLHQQIGGPDTLADQLRHLVTLSETPEITLKVIPFSQSAFTNTGGGPFVLYSYPDPLDFDVVQVAYLHGDLYSEEDETVTKYRKAFERLQATALPPEQSVELISSISRDLERG